MRHNRRVKHFSRDTNARKALLRGLMVSLVEHGRIKTTVEKAKELRRHIEKVVTIGRNDDLATRRLLLSRIPNQKTVETIISDISKRFAGRPGGYTRIIKIGRRPGDTAEMAFIEFVDYNWEKSSKASGKLEKTDSGKAKKTEKIDATKDVAATKEKSKTAKKITKLVAAKKKSVKKVQKKSRQASRRA